MKKNEIIFVSLIDTLRRFITSGKDSGILVCKIEVNFKVDWFDPFRKLNMFLVNCSNIFKRASVIFKCLCHVQVPTFCKMVFQSYLLPSSDEMSTSETSEEPPNIYWLQNEMRASRNPIGICQPLVCALTTIEIWPLPGWLSKSMRCYPLYNKIISVNSYQKSFLNWYLKT